MLALSDVLGEGFEIPPDRFDRPADFASQLAAYEAEPPVRVRFDVGGEADGEPVAAFDDDRRRRGRSRTPPPRPGGSGAEGTLADGAARRRGAPTATGTTPTRSRA